MNLNYWNAVLCRYCEIATKGQNRSMFENCLASNILRLLNKIDNIEVPRVRGRLWVQHRERLPFSSDELNFIKENLAKAFGLASFSPGIICKPDIGEILSAVKSSSAHIFEPSLRKAGNLSVSFRARASRSNKQYPLTSKDIEIEIAKIIGENYDNERLKVDLEDADITIGCDLREEFAFVFYETYSGPGGLPTGSNARVLALLSGGIDSPVACYLMMKRGCPVDFLAFHSTPYTPPETVEKVRRIVEKLNAYQQPGRLFTCNLAPIQKIIRDTCAERFRTVLYRRMMFRIAEKIAKKNKNKALITGEAVGQVASQTIANLGTINNATDMLVLRPLSGMDKEEIISIAKKMGTYEISIEQTPDSCTVFAPKSPATSVSVERILKEENKFDVSTLLDELW